MDALRDSLGQSFFTRALLEAVLVGAVSGIVGVHVLLRRLPFFVVAMSHATFPGVVLASMLGISLFLGGSAFGLLVVVLLVVLSPASGAGRLGLQRAVDDTSLVGVVLAGSFAGGILLQSARTDASKELSAFLVGSILTVTPADLVTTALLGGLVLALLAAAHKELVLTAFDPAAAAAAGYRLRLVDLGVLGLVTVALVTTVPAVGTLLAMALLTVPALTARLWTDHIPRCMLIAALVGAGSGVIGLCLSATYDIAAGGAIALTATFAFLGSFLLTLPRSGAAARLDTIPRP